MPRASIVTSDATKPPMLTMPVAVPSRVGGLKLRAKSKPTIEPGPPTARTSTSTTSSSMRRGPGPEQHDGPHRRPSCRRWSAPARSGAAGAARRTGRKPVRHRGIRRPAGSSSDLAACGRQTLAGDEEREAPEQREDRAGELRAEVRPEPQPGPRVQPGRAQLAQDRAQAERPSPACGGPGALRTAMTASHRREDPQRRDGQVGRRPAVQPEQGGQRDGAQQLTGLADHARSAG